MGLGPVLRGFFADEVSGKAILPWYGASKKARSHQLHKVGCHLAIIRYKESTGAFRNVMYPAACNIMIMLYSGTRTNHYKDPVMNQPVLGFV